MFSILDGREHFYQWDKDRKLIVKDGSIDKVHFCNRTGSCSLVRCVYEVKGTYLVDVPNILLQDNYRLSVYGYDRNYTKHSQTFNIVARTRPEDYVYTEEEKAQWEELEERINQIEENGVSDEAVANAIENYLTENPIETGATEEQAEQIAANTEAIDGLVIELDNYYTKAETDALLADLPTGGEGGGTTTDLTNYYTKEETDAAIEAAQPNLATYLHTKGDLEGADLDEVKELGIYNLTTSYTYTNTPADPNALKNGMLVVYSIGVSVIQLYYGRANGAGMYMRRFVSGAWTAWNTIATIDEIPDVSAYQTAEQVQTAITTALAGIGVAEEGAY